MMKNNLYKDLESLIKDNGNYSLEKTYDNYIKYNKYIFDKYQDINLDFLIDDPISNTLRHLTLEEFEKEYKKYKNNYK